MSNRATFTCLKKGEINGKHPCRVYLRKNPRNSLPALILNTGKTRGKVKECDVLSNGLTVSRGVTRIQRRLGRLEYSSTALTITCHNLCPGGQDVFGNTYNFAVSAVR